MDDDKAKRLAEVRAQVAEAGGYPEAELVGEPVRDVLEECERNGTDVWWGCVDSIIDLRF